MLRLNRVLRLIRPFARRAFGVGVIGLQLCVTTSAVWEARTERRLDVHAEENGTRHLDQHSEDACALCSVRTEASMPSVLPYAAETVDESRTTAFQPQPAPDTADPLTVRSRAPPTLPA
ncbi:MAG: hypothetical protein O2973_11935 [Gemmatimonadetes bacterium]|nr:hypothetical protein [Gemmatimonadota bacterium]